MDITRLILADHARQREMFAELDEIDRSDKAALAAVWNRLRALLDAHAEAEERFFYPELLKRGHGAVDSDSAKDETCDAIKDHNEIRNAAAAVEREEVGSDAWFAAIDKANKANSDHMAEEERQGLTDFRRHASLETRHQIGVKFITFENAHIQGVKPVDKDPSEYVKDPEKAMSEAEA